MIILCIFETAQKKKNYKENKNDTLIQKNIVKIAEILFDYFYGDLKIIRKDLLEVYLA